MHYTLLAPHQRKNLTRRVKIHTIFSFIKICKTRTQFRQSDVRLITVGICAQCTIIQCFNSCIRGRQIRTPNAQVDYVFTGSLHCSNLFKLNGKIVFLNVLNPMSRKKFHARICVCTMFKHFAFLLHILPRF